MQRESTTVSSRLEGKATVLVSMLLSLLIEFVSFAAILVACYR
jgi:hypothetical protein